MLEDSQRWSVTDFEVKMGSSCAFSTRDKIKLLGADTSTNKGKWVPEKAALAADDLRH